MNASVYTEGGAREGEGMTNEGVIVGGSSFSIPRNEKIGAATTTSSPAWTWPAAQYQLQRVVACVPDVWWWECWEACPTAWAERTPPSMRSMATKQAARNGDRSVRIMMTWKMECYCSDRLHIFSSIISLLAPQLIRARAKNLPFPKYAVFHLRPNIFRIPRELQEASSPWNAPLTSFFTHDTTWSTRKIPRNTRPN